MKFIDFMKFYLDSCIWLNLFKKEVCSYTKQKLWKFSFDFINENFDKIVFSGIVLREIEFVLKNKDLYSLKKDFLKNNFIFIKILDNDYNLARKFEILDNFSLSFYDYLHIAICKNNNLILISRDKEMLKFAKNYIFAKKPEKN